MQADDAHNQRHSIIFNRVSKHYGAVCALDDVSLDIPAAQTTAIVGPSGCGKSTLLRLVNALQVPDRGDLQIDGKNFNTHNLQALRRRMGYCVQSIALFPHLSIRENICLLAQLEQWPTEKLTNRLRTLLHLTALESDLLNRYPHQLSGGQQQRAGLCRALMLNPDFLLLDEPLAAVDPITRLDIHAQYLQLQAQEPRTTLLVTHDIQEALKLADSIVVMRAGAIIAHHASADLKTMPNSETVLLNQIRHGHA